MNKAPEVSIVIPTVEGRESSLRRAVRSYVKTLAETPYEIIIVRDKSTCGEAWAEGAKSAEAPLLHLTADDIEALPGWLEAAKAAATQCTIPAPRVFSPSVPHQASYGHNGDGQLLPLDTLPLTACKVSVIPTLPTRLWESILPMPHIHYYSDDYVSLRARMGGFKVMTWPGYEFIHHFESGGARPDMTDRILRDRTTYFQMARM